MRMCQVKVLPDTLRAREKSWPSARSILELMGMGAGPSCEDFTRAEMLEAVNADFMPLEVTVTVFVISASALFFLRVGQEVLIRQDSKYSWLPSHILLLPDLLLPGSFNQKFISECT